MRSSWCFSSISATITLLSFPGWNWNSSTIATLLDRFCPWKQQNLSERGQFLNQKPAWESKPKGGCIRVLVQLCLTVCVRENHKISANGQKRLIQNMPAVLCRKPSPGISRHFIFAEDAHKHIVDHTLST